MMCKHQYSASLFLLVCVLFLFQPSSGAANSEMPSKRGVTVPVRLAPVYNFDIPVRQTSDSKQKIILRSTMTRAGGIQIATTEYDRQHIGSMARQIEHRGHGAVHFVWSGLNDDQAIHYWAYEVDPGCGSVGDIRRVTTSVNSGMYAALDIHAKDAAIPAGYEFDVTDTTFTYWDNFTGTFLPYGPDDLEGDYGGRYIWPKIEWQISDDGTDTVLHMVTTELKEDQNKPMTIAYYRRVGGYNSPSATWQGPQTIDSVMTTGVAIAASPTSNRVALVWNAPCDYLNNENDWNQYENDVWYAISGNLGSDLFYGQYNSIADVVGAKAATYNDTDEWKAYCDLSALFSSSDDNLHIVWNSRRWDGADYIYWRQSAIFHWSEDYPSIRPVVEAKWDSGGRCYGHPWGADVGKMSLSQCDGRLYILYTQFGNTGNPCHDTCALNQLINGELYLTVSPDNGYWWDRPQNLTNTVTDGCDPDAAEDCASEYWASMARYGRMENCAPLAGSNVLDILYINDVYPDVQTGYANPVMWLRIVCRDMVDEPLYADDAAYGYGSDYSDEEVQVSIGGQTTIQLHMYNPGSQPNDFSFGVDYIDGDNWVSPIPDNGTIPAYWEDTVTRDITFHGPTDAAYGDVYRCVIHVYNGADDSPRDIPVAMKISPFDIMIADCDDDVGNIPDVECNHKWWKSPDIWIDNNDDGVIDAPVYGEVNHLYVRVSNIGNDAVYNTTVRCWYRDPTTGLRFPAEGAQIIADCDDESDSVKTIDVIGIGDEQRIYFEWEIPGSLSGTHYCLGCLALAEKDSNLNINPYRNNNSGVINSGYLARKKGSTPKNIVGADKQDTTWFVQTINVDNPFDGYSEFYMKVESLQVTEGWGISPDAALDYADTVVSFTLSPEGDTSFTYRIIAPPDVQHLATSPINFNLYGPSPNIPAGGVHFNLLIDDYPPDSVTGFEVAGRNPYTLTWYEPDKDIVDSNEIIRYFKIYVDADSARLLTPITTPPSDTIMTRLDADSDPENGYQYEYYSSGKEATYFTIIPVDLADNEGQPVAPLTGSGGYVCGDANRDGSVSVGDVVYLINYVFKGGPPPDPFCIGDANGDNDVNIGDAVYLISYIFKGGPGPVAGCCQ